jgi:hypothetical protein
MSKEEIKNIIKERFPTIPKLQNVIIDNHGEDIYAVKVIYKDEVFVGCSSEYELNKFIKEESQHCTMNGCNCCPFNDGKGCMRVKNS